MIFRLPIIAAVGSLALAVSLSAGDPCPSTFTVVWPDGKKSPGVPVEQPGWFITVVPDLVELKGLGKATLENDNQKTEAKILFADVSQRLCLLETDAEFAQVRVFTVSDSVELKAGQKLECLSNRSACLTALAGKDWSLRGEQLPMPLLRVRVSDPEHFCATGTPLICGEGELVGLLIGQEPDTASDAFAIPASRIHKLIEEVKRFKKSGPVWVGLIFDNHCSTPEVLDVKPESPAETAGVLSGDVILSVNGSEIESLHDLVETISDLPAGEEAQLKVLRGFSETELKITPCFAENSSTRQ